MKRLFSYLFFLLIVGLMFTYSSCDKPEPDPYVSPFTGDTLDVNDTFQSYWNFPVGSWWVYKRTDTTADIYDTAVLIRNVKEVLCRYPPDCYYHRNLHIKHSNWNVIWHDELRNVDTVSKPLMILYSEFPDILNISGDFGFAMYLSWPYKFKETPYGQIQDTTAWNSLIGSKVLSVKILSPHFNYIRYAQGIGVVNFRYDNATTWQLVDFKINE